MVKKNCGEKYGTTDKDDTHRLKEKVHARYIRIESKGIAGGGSSVAIAELEFFE